VKKSPVTFTTDPTAEGGVRNSLQLYVDRVLWKERSALYGSGPKDRIFTTELDDDHKMIVRLGDGINGSLAPSGRANIVATYRQFLGREGNVDAGQIETALDKPTGLREVINPLPATGGVDAETIEAARTNAPTTVRTFDRAISVSDFGHLAQEFVGVAKAHADWAWDGEERVVFVTVGGDAGAPLGTKLADVQTYLDFRRDPNRSVRVGEYRSIPFVLTIEIEVESNRFNEDVEAEARAAVEDYFSYEARSFGQAVHLSDLYAVAHEVEPVVSARIVRLRYERFVDRITHGVFDEVAVHAPIFGARHSGGVLRPAGLATLDSPGDLVINASGGLER
jgi:predicted phage baseplate assembly protein